MAKIAISAIGMLVISLVEGIGVVFRVKLYKSGVLTSLEGFSGVSTGSQQGCL
jgi:hypothetical protein